MQRQKKTGRRKPRSKFKELRQQIKADIKKQPDLYVNKLVGVIKVLLLVYQQSEKTNKQNKTKKTQKTLGFLRRNPSLCTPTRY